MQESILNVVDFDETLFRVPGFTSAGPEFTKPYEWFDSPASLNMDLHRIQLIETVNSMLEPDHTNIIVSHRVAALKSAMLSVLKKFEIKSKFDQVILCERTLNKAERLVAYIEENTVETEPFNKIRIFEDSIAQLDKYMKNTILNGFGIEIEYWFVDKTEIIQIPKIGIIDRKRLELKYL